ncbi:glycosyl transferase family 90 [Methylobacterium sp. V23]|uniref:glycosyl transferase family 90 n=1 Tax=Methylobacterium sp. V23 TaxID=2044878 RepID=UPI000CD9FE1B|nr:glycosyl transferase family 90 [Methylobacterium sp. V23]POR42582.1 hypothetical protein CRT23_12395 [Methylobacterium sp. V23]
MPHILNSIRDIFAYSSKRKRPDAQQYGILNAANNEAMLQFAEACVLQQMAPWADATIKLREIQPAIDNAVENECTIFVIQIDGSSATLKDKAQAAYFRTVGAPMQVFEDRAYHYWQHISEALKLAPIPGRFEIAVDTGDMRGDCSAFPLFTFQKQRGSRNILLPDHEFMEYAYFENLPHETTEYEEKKTLASFYGSSTSGGLPITMEAAVNLEIPRLRAAAFFKNTPHVEFSITQLVQCFGPGVEEYLRSLGYGGKVVDWSECLKGKFILSLDGNGATCSRVSRALLSNSALIKYKSENVLFYSDNLIPWLHYIPVSEDAEVLTVVAEELNHPGKYKFIAEASRDFSAAHLSKQSLLLYTSKLLNSYWNKFVYT